MRIREGDKTDQAPIQVPVWLRGCFCSTLGPWALVFPGFTSQFCVFQVDLRLTFDPRRLEPGSW